MPESISPSQITPFSVDECQALLDYVERLERHVRIAAAFVPQYEGAFRTTDDEMAALGRLREAGKFYVPDERNRRIRNYEALRYALATLTDKDQDYLSAHTYGELLAFAAEEIAAEQKRITTQV